MELPVLASPVAQEPWYADGLAFHCTQCGNCCTGSPGVVWISEREIAALADHLGLTPQETAQRYCHKVAGRFSLTESRNPNHGGYDCVFLRELPPEAGDGQTVAHARRICSIYPVRPLQCRTWPFWKSCLTSPQAWAGAGQRCPGIGQGPVLSQQQIESARDQAPAAADSE